VLYATLAVKCSLAVLMGNYPQRSQPPRPVLWGRDHSFIRTIIAAALYSLP